MKQIVGVKEDKDSLHVVTELSNLLGNGQAPEKLRPFLGGSSGFAFRKCSEPHADGLRSFGVAHLPSSSSWNSSEEILPSLQEFGCMDITTCEFLEPKLLPKADKFHVATIRNVVELNVPDAWAVAASSYEMGEW